MPYNYERVVKSKIKCPKCKSLDLILIEIWIGHSIEWVQENGEFDRNDGNMEAGFIDHVDSKCIKCSHSWRIRKAKSIDDIIK